MGHVTEHANRWAGLMAVQIQPQMGGGYNPMAPSRLDPLRLAPLKLASLRAAEMVQITEDGLQTKKIGRERVPALVQTHEYSAVI
jgi:hypothetical protein